MWLTLAQSKNAPKISIPCLGPLKGGVVDSCDPVAYTWPVDTDGTNNIIDEADAVACAWAVMILKGLHRRPSYPVALFVHSLVVFELWIGLRIGSNEFEVQVHHSIHRKNEIHELNISKIANSWIGHGCWWIFGRHVTPQMTTDIELKNEVKDKAMKITQMKKTYWRYLFFDMITLVLQGVEKAR